MKKRLWILVVAALLAILLIPIPGSAYEDGGTREYSALLYKIVDWNRLTADGIYDETKVYFFPKNFKSIDGLWYYEKNNVPNMFIAKVVLIGENYVEVEPLENEDERKSADRITVNTADLEDIGIAPGSLVEVTYTGAIMESYPAQVNATSWKNAGDLRFMEYTEQWLDKATAEKYDNDIFSHIRITKIYSNCFFARTVIPMPYEIKLNGTLSEEWCVGDQVLCTYENTYYDRENNRVEVDMLGVEASDWQPDPYAAYKPVIYLYPEEETQVRVELVLDGRLTCTYPAYHSGWTVTAAPDGMLTDAKGQIYNYLYWEGETNAQWDMEKGFCVRGEDTAAFLETALAQLGLTRREANEFIVYWLPLMQENPYNIIAFQEDAYTDAAKLDISPAPDTLIRVFMTWKASETFVKLEPQVLTAPERTGFTVVEWGGTEQSGQ